MSDQPCPFQGGFIITMLGSFSIEYCGKIISETSSRTHQVWNLLEYLIANRNKSISQDSLFAAIWPDDNCENPTNALKNLIYRIRALLSSHGIVFSKEVIVFQKGTYVWNNQIPCRVDVEEFQTCCQRATWPDRTRQQKIELYKRAIDLYKGNFLPSSPNDEWVLNESLVYRTSYFNCIYKVVELLEEESRYIEIQSICDAAMVIDQYEENLHLILIHSLVEQGKQQQALQHYNRVVNLFMKKLGVTPSPEMRLLYREITRAVHNVETNLDVIRWGLQEKTCSSGAFLCEYEVFKDIYQIVSRSVPRIDTAVYIGLLTLTLPSGNIPEPPALTVAMDKLQDSIRTSLRLGDVFAKFSSSQFVVICSALSYANGIIAIDRIIEKYRKLCRNQDIMVLSNLQLIDSSPNFVNL